MSAYVSNLKDLLNSWGDAFAKRNGTSLVGIQMQYKQPSSQSTPSLSFRVWNVHYTGQGDSSPLPGLVITDTTTNNTDIQQTSEFKRTKSSTSTFTWAMKEAISVGVSLEVDIGVPSIASAMTTITTKISMESTQSITKQETQSWEIDRNVAVPPHSRVDMTWSIIERNIQATFECDVVITNAVWVTFEERVNPDRGNIWSRDWIMPIEFIFESMDNIGFAYPSQYTRDLSSVVYKASGVCSAALGLTTTFDLEQKPLTEDTPALRYRENVLPVNLK